MFWQILPSNFRGLRPCLACSNAVHRSSHGQLWHFTKRSGQDQICRQRWVKKDLHCLKINSIKPRFLRQCFERQFHLLLRALWYSVMCLDDIPIVMNLQKQLATTCAQRFYSSVLNWSYVATIWNTTFIWIVSFSQIWAMFTIWINSFS